MYLVVKVHVNNVDLSTFSDFAGKSPSTYSFIEHFEPKVELAGVFPYKRYIIDHFRTYKEFFPLTHS